MTTPEALHQINQRVIKCERCPELRSYCAEIARTKRRSYADRDYWGRPVPSFGDPRAWLWIVGLAPAAHGANRTGRMFTGDRSGDFLFAGLFRADLANQPDSISRSDGLKLSGAYISACLRCAPPANKPTSAQLSECRRYLVDEWRALRDTCVILSLGGIAWGEVLKTAASMGMAIGRPRPRFAHGAEAVLGRRGPTLLGCYHVSQQNTFTGRLTPAMLDAVLLRALAIKSAGESRLECRDP